VTKIHNQLERGLGLRLLIIFLARAVINVSFRIIYPFLPSIARGLGISLAAAGGLVTLRMVAGMGMPLIGPLADRWDRRRIMEIGLALFVLASMLLSSVGTFFAAIIAFILFGVAKSLYDLAAYAYVGDAVPYHRRGRAVGTIELAWSSAWLLGVPASGFLIEHLGWRAPWAVLIALGVLGAWLTRAKLPPVLRPATAQEHRERIFASTVNVWRDLLRRRSIVALLMTSLLLSLAIEVVFIVYGAWLETTFGLSLTVLGLASAVVGLAEATAEFGTTVLTDRLGKRRSVLIGMLGLTVSLIVLPWLSDLGLVTALVGVALIMLTFEFGVVSLLPLVTELAPDARASLFAFNLTAFSLGRILGASLGSWLWTWRSIALHTGVGAVCAISAVLFLALGTTEITE